MWFSDNSANAEESASAAEEMSAQAEQMKQFVGELATMVGGATAVQTEAPQHGKRSHRRRPQKGRKCLQLMKRKQTAISGRAMERLRSLRQRRF